MLQALDLLKSLEISLSKAKFKRIVDDCEEERIPACFGPSSFETNECLRILSLIFNSISLPELKAKDQVEKFCLSNASLILCTVSSSIKLYTEGLRQVQFLVIDEAAQLKECESTIPLQLPGLCHCILIGDERQLPALVKSKVLDRCLFIILELYIFSQFFVRLYLPRNPNSGLSGFFPGNQRVNTKKKLVRENMKYISNNNFDRFS
jgi:senataxin